jgi:hypothetical protein
MRQAYVNCQAPDTSPSLRLLRILQKPTVRCEALQPHKNKCPDLLRPADAGKALVVQGAQTGWGMTAASYTVRKQIIALRCERYHRALAHLIEHLCTGTLPWGAF